MKKIWKIKKYYLIFSIILTLFLPTLNNIYNVKKENNRDSVNNFLELESAGYWYFTGEAIVIDDSDPGSNWSYTVTNNDWCSGSGTWSDPYIIENVTVDYYGISLGNSIYIRNSKNSYFIIRNCTLDNSYPDTDPENVGIKLENVDNGILMNNTFTLNEYGISLSSNCDNNTILENKLIDNEAVGVELAGGCGGNIISKNIIDHTEQYGIICSYSSNGNNITNNIIKNNGWHWGLEADSGIMILSSDDNIVSNNEITNNNQNGIYIYSDYCYDNVIINNTISGNRKGIRMAYNVFGTTIRDNLIRDNSEYGIYIATYHPQGSDIYLNWFIDNGIQAYDNVVGQNNDWDNGPIGNFWSDYAGVDVDDNGIGDTPYLIGGDNGGNQDTYPICHDSPNIKIESPQPYEIYESLAPTFNVSIKDPNLDSMWYTLNNGMQKVPFSTNETINQGLWDVLSDGLIDITFYANDTAGNVNSSSVTVIRDTGGPTIHINSPAQYDVFALTEPTFNVEIRDFLLNTTWYTIDGGLTKFIFTSNGSLNPNEWDNALDGLVSITFYANDTIGNLNSASVTVYKDTQIPYIWIVYPDYGDVFNTTAPDFIVELDEVNIVRMWYTINFSLTEYTFTTNGTINQAAWDALPKGVLVLKFFIEDIAGNIEFDEVVITKSLPTDGNGDGDGNTEPAIPGYQLILLISLIWIMSTMILIQLKKNLKNK